MSNPQHVEIARKGTKAIADWRESQPTEVFDLSDEKLRRAHLRRADLRGANLHGVDLGGVLPSSSSHISEYVGLMKQIPIETRRPQSEHSTRRVDGTRTSAPFNVSHFGVVC